MKKLLLGSIILLVFNLIVILTQMSCKKEASAQVDNSGNSKPLNLILYIKDKTNELWVANIDGSNQKKIPIPDGIKPSDSRLTPDGKTVIFLGWKDNDSNAAGIYSCSLDGSNLKKLINENGEMFTLQEVY